MNFNVHEEQVFHTKQQTYPQVLPQMSDVAEATMMEASIFLSQWAEENYAQK